MKVSKMTEDAQFTLDAKINLIYRDLFNVSGARENGMTYASFLAGLLMADEADRVRVGVLKQFDRPAWDRPYEGSVEQFLGFGPEQFEAKLKLEERNSYFDDAGA